MFSTFFEQKALHIKKLAELEAKIRELEWKIEMDNKKKEFKKPTKVKRILKILGE